MAESRVSLEELTEAAFTGVLRALEARKIPPHRPARPRLGLITSQQGVMRRD